MSSISGVSALEGYCLEIQLDNGCKVLLDLKSKLGTIRFGALLDDSFFRTVATDGFCIRWGNIVEISLNEVFQIAQK